MTDEKLLALPGNDLSVFTDVERLLIELADTLAESPANVSDDLYARLREHFSEEQLLELGAQISSMWVATNSTNRRTLRASPSRKPKLGKDKTPCLYFPLGRLSRQSSI